MLAGFFAALSILTNLLDVVTAVSAGDTNVRFDVVGSVTDVNRSKSALFAMKTTDGCMVFRDVTKNRQSLSLWPGNIVRAKGRISINEYDYPAANCNELSFLCEGTAPRVTDVPTADLATKALNGKLIRVHGVVRETFRDEIDPKYVYLTLVDDGFFFTVSICDDMENDDFLNSLIDAEISVVGRYASDRIGLRRMLGWTLSTFTVDDITILKPAPADPFNAPPLPDSDAASPQEVATMGKRSISGRVIATRRARDFLVVDPRGTVRRIRPRNQDCPSYGDIVEAVGYPETDLYRLNLGDAIWRKTGVATNGLDAPVAADILRILTDGRGNRKINPLFHGKAIRVTGTVVDVTSANRQFETVTLKCGDLSIPVDISENPGLAETMAVGSRLSVAGTCIVETESWRPYSAFPHATGITLVVRRPEDVTVISRPPWWTPMKLLFVVSSLLLALVVFFVWNRILNRLVYKRSHALIKEQLALAKTELKVAERTNLAIELHDSLSQNLSAVAFQILATKSAAEVSPGEVMENLNAAERMLLSCRTELKRCLWDLRNDALDVGNMSDAIQKALAPVKGNAILSVRFNVIRSNLDESTFHAVIRIVRELVSNAIQHGRASHVCVAGDLAGDALSFSVKDDGTGFDVATAPGPADGHFGLAGVSERVKRHNGRVQVESSPGKGTKINVKLQVKN
ncbi:MAG: hypothetical protein IJI35_17770 [Kiritimatiellae bacterium]|nr:hypothetical protein [Kiritimatiellia bacterium]